jgi:hypothetical protein
MSKGWLASIVVLLASARVASAQAPTAADAILPPPTTAAAPIEVGHLNTVDSLLGGDDSSRCWIRAEYLLWWTKGSPNPSPLLTSVAAGTPTGGSPIPGAVGGAGTSVIMGGSDIDSSARSGARFTLGGWLDPSKVVGLEGNYFFLQPSIQSQSASSQGGLAAPTLMIPFYDVTGTFTGGPPGQSAVLPALAQLFSIPGGLTGPFISHDTLTLRSTLQGAEANSLLNLARFGRLRFDSLFGFRYLNIDENLDFTTSSQTTASAPQSITYNTEDSFRTTNNFFGGQLGLRAEYSPDDGRGGWAGGFCYRAAFKLALGDTVENVNINGSTTTNIGNPPLSSLASYAGGVFAQPSNMGSHNTDHFAAVPEVDLNVGYSLFSWARVFLGYNFLFISDIARPGNQIDPGLNLYRSSLVQASNPPIAAPPNDPARPAYSTNQSSFWAQGINFGVECRF